MGSYLLRRSSRTLWRIRYRALGSASLIVASAALYVSLAAMIPSAERALEEKVTELALSDYLVHVSGGRENETATLVAIEGVERVEARLQSSSRIEQGHTGGERTTAATLVGLDPSRRSLVNSVEVTKGSYFDGCGTALLERNFAVRAGLGVGDRIRVLTAGGREELRIAGLVLSPEHLVLSSSPQALIPAPGTLAVVFVPRDWLRSAFGLGTDDVNEFLFLLSDPGPEVRRAIDAALARDIVIYSLKKDEVYGYALIKEDLRQGESWAAVIALIMLLIAFFITYVSLTRLVQEQRREIGVLRALGYSRGAVLGAYLYLAALIGLAGSVTGVLIGASLAHALSGFYVELMIGAPLVSFTLSPKTLTVGLFFGPLTTLLVCSVAVWGTVSLEPQEAIRGSPPVRFSPRDCSGCALSAPVRGTYLTHYAFMHLSSHPVRTCLTTLAVSGSIVIGCMALLMWPAFVNSLSQSLHESERWELLVEFSSPLNASQLSALAPGDAVEVAPLSQITAS
ncbi:MAG: FtsX-like permease family protein [Thermoplasmata archaeon]